MTVIIIVPIVWIISWLVYIILRGCKNYVVPWHNKIDRFVFFNGTIAFIDETYLLLVLAAVLNSHYFRWDTYGNKVSSILTGVLCGVVLGLPIFSCSFFSAKTSF